MADPAKIVESLIIEMYNLPSVKVINNNFMATLPVKLQVGVTIMGRQVCFTTQFRMAQSNHFMLEYFSLTGLEGTPNEIKSQFIRLGAEKMNINIPVSQMAVCMPPLPINSVGSQTNKLTAVTLMLSRTWSRRLVFNRRLLLKGTHIYRIADN